METSSGWFNGLVPTSSQRPGSILVAIAAVIVVLLPSSLLTVVSPVEWERETFRFLAFFAIPVAWLWPWAMRQGGGTATRMRRWVAGLALALVAYAFFGSPLFLVVGVCLVAGCAAGIGVERGHVASELARRRLGQRAEGGAPRRIT